MGDGSSTAGRWILSLVIYFFAFIIIVTYASQLGDGVTYSGDDLINKSLASVSSGVCSEPRLFYNSDGTKREVSGSSSRIASCWATEGFIYDDVCNSIEGCTWEEANPVYCFFFTCSTNNTICSGSINLTYYGSNSSDLSSRNSICSISGLQGNRNACESFGCTYYSSYSEIPTGIRENKDSILETVADLVSFRADIGIPQSYNYLFSFIFFYLPFLGLVLSIGMYIRG